VQVAVANSLSLHTITSYSAGVLLLAGQAGVSWPQHIHCVGPAAGQLSPLLPPPLPPPAWASSQQLRARHLHLRGTA